MNKERWFANLVLLGGSVASAGAGLLALGTARNFQVSMAREALLVGGPFCLSVVLLACLRLPLPVRTTLSVTLVSLATAAYIMEIYLRNLPSLRVRLAARRFGIPFDGRSQFEVVRDLRHQGIEAYPAAFPAWQGLPSEDSSLLPLGGISSVTTVFCNEMGGYIVYRSDEHGFHNPEGIWSSGRFDVAVLGDSFTQGACVPTEQNFVERIRARYPATLNLGMVGNGPLLMLAGLREYLTEAKPGIVLWVYMEGSDLTFDLNREKRYTRLTDYLLPDHRQGLLARQSECDALLRRLVDQVYDSLHAGTMHMSPPGGFWQLRSLRKALGLQIEQTRLDPSSVDLPLFRQVLEEARQAVQKWGGRLYFVYLPTEPRFIDKRQRPDMDWARGQVLSIVEDLKIPLIDLLPPFSRHPDASELYAYRGAHFSPEGNRLAAETILEALHASTSR